jgi:hypothetical protein
MNKRLRCATNSRDVGIETESFVRGLWGFVLGRGSGWVLMASRVSENRMIVAGGSGVILRWLGVEFWG